ncbi:hypothetical protein JCM6882_002894 [Rhodosporidiobolus microsporus]
MPPAPKSKGFALDQSYRFIFTWELDFDLTKDKFAFRRPSNTVPLCGDWSADAVRDGAGVQIGIDHGGNVPTGLFGQEVEMTLELFWVDSRSAARSVASVRYCPVPLPVPSDASGVLSGSALQILPKDWLRSAEKSGAEYKPESHRAYRFVVVMQQRFPKDAVKQQAEQAERLAGLHLQQLPHDVRLFFPLAHDDGAELWAKADFLACSSPYLKDLLASDFAESKPRRSKRVRTGGGAEAEISEAEVAAVTGDEKDYVDSDDETDDFLFSERPPKLEQSSEADEVSYRQITITQTAFSTYHAVIVYLQTGFIHFAPLTSSFPSPDCLSPDDPSRTDFLSQSFTDKPALPLPVSPKSAYRLAHLLQLDDLQKRSLDTFRSCLSVSNAADELFSDVSVAYDEVREIVVEFVQEHWNEVRQTEGWKERKAAVKGRECTAEVAAIAMEVLEAVADP